MNLYEKEIEKLNQTINLWIENNPDSELTSEIVNSILENVEGDIKDKAENICKYIKYLESQNELYKNEIQRIQSAKKTNENTIARLKNYLVPYAENKDIKQVGTFKLSLRSSSSINIIDESVIPDDFKICETIVRIDKRKLKEVFVFNQENNIALPKGCELINNKNLQIK